MKYCKQNDLNYIRYLFKSFPFKDVISAFNKCRSYRKTNDFVDYIICLDKYTKVESNLLKI